MEHQKHYLLITCSVLYRECYSCAAVSKNMIEIRILEQGLHDIGEAKMSKKLQEEINKVDSEQYDAILLGYGLCNNGIRGLRSPLPLVIPRAHDCITLLMGSKEKYRSYFDNNPGVFYQSVGWVECAKGNLSNPDSTTTQIGMKTYEEYVKEYGEENAKYIIETLGGGLNNYSKMTFIKTNVCNDSFHKNHTKQESKEKKWEYEEYQGNTKILLAMNLII
ncbi:MAG: DUF1638 domain-containing protein [bacterium]|nr:DUF1638 domain-containing protein [bacterium]